MILAIESSCDESAMALFDPHHGLCGEWVHSQIELHREYGGVVPDLAGREHLSAFPLLMHENKIADWLDKVTSIAVTQGPGLAACLAMGVAVAKSLALARGVPLLPVNHLRGHAFSPFIELHASAPKLFDAQLQPFLPHLGAIVSGGNTIVFVIDEQRHIEVIAETVDDAAGEALDKGAKLLGLPYPGGPEIEKRAAQGDARRHVFPAGQRAKDDLRFSFSGLKTSLRYRLESMDANVLAEQMNHLCAGYQYAVMRQLTLLTERILKQSKGNYRSLGLSGGVANNGSLRDAWQRMGKRMQLPVFFAKSKHTGDNAGMIAFAAFADPTVADNAVHGLGLPIMPSLRLANCVHAPNHSVL